ncbi:MAG: hypothetical protein ACP6IS_10440 [Candidatus Asgardarchaeia archaeon]
MVLSNRGNGGRRKYDGPVGLGVWLQKTHRKKKRTEQELEVRKVLEELNVEFEEQYAISLGYNEGRPGVRREMGVNWAVVDFFIKGKRRDIVLECGRYNMGKSRNHLMERIRIKSRELNLRFFEMKSRYDLVCVAFIEAPVPDLKGYIEPRIPYADFIVDNFDDLRKLISRLAE